MTTLNEQEFAQFKTWLKEHLSAGEVKLVFTKKDGTDREMTCTTNDALIPATPIVEAHETNTDNPIDFPVKKEKKVNEDVMPVYDLEAQGWRSFRWDSVKEVKITIGEDSEHDTQPQ
jgi:hypothetical protein